MTEIFNMCDHYPGLKKINPNQRLMSRNVMPFEDN